MEKLHNVIDYIKRFIDKYSDIGEAHMVDYFVKDHWHQLLNDDTRTSLLKLPLPQIRQLPLLVSSKSASLQKNDFSSVFRKENDFYCYLNDAQSCQQKFLSVLVSVFDVFEQLPLDKVDMKSSDMCLKIDSTDYMCSKKSHEVSALSPIINHLCRFCQTRAVLDVGSGKGYLSAFLSLRYDLSVIGIEANENNVLSANERTKKYFKYCLKRSENFEFRENFLASTEKEFKFQSIVTRLAQDTCLSDVGSSSKYVVTGLHACGDLSSNVVSLFVNQSSYVGLCVVGCCYHHNTERHETNNGENPGFPMSSYLTKHAAKLGRTKRMLALQAPEKTTASEHGTGFTKSEMSLFYRAVLSVIMKEELRIDAEKHDYKVGKIFAKSKNFVDYVRSCFRKLKLNDSSLTDDTIMSYYKRHEPSLKELMAFVVVRQIYAPAIEALIVLDKYCYLLEKATQCGVSHCFLSEIFDPLLSPRRYALIAVKNPN